MTAGCTLLGGTSYAVMDNSPLACETLNMQPTTVVAGDISDPQARRQLHFIQANTRCMLGASLPGPGCCRDLASGFSVQGCPLLCHVLQAAWHMQASGVILECELNLLDNQQCAAWLREFAIKAGFHQAQVVLDLAQQWSARRVRWWAVLLPASLPALQLSSWPLLPELRKVGDVTPVWPQWADEIEQALRWDDAEQQAFSDPDLGPTHRTLALTQQSPPALHSWGNVFRPCPCGCRPQPFAKGPVACCPPGPLDHPSSTSGRLGAGIHSSRHGTGAGLRPNHSCCADPEQAGVSRPGAPHLAQAPGPCSPFVGMVASTA